MKAIKLAPIAMTLTLILGVLPAAAEHRVHEREIAGLEILSHKLAMATGELRDQVAANRRRGHSHQHYTLRTLDRLDRDAKTFHFLVEREGATDRATRRAFRQLEISFDVASERPLALHSRHGVRHDFSLVAGLMDKVETRMARIDPRHDPRRHAGHGGAGDRRPGRNLAWNYHN